MPFVDVHRGWKNAEPSEHAHSTDAQNDLLPQPLFGVVRVQAMSDGAIPRLIALNFRIEKVDWDAANVSAPHQNVNGRIEKRDKNFQRFAVSVANQSDGIVGAI
jgi:hypothetical protein